jgi:drug/metabolite transporter (DMT)-like permease
MYWGSSALSVLVGVVGGVLLVCAFILGRRWGRRRAVGAAGAGLMLLGLSLSGVIDVLGKALSLLSFNPLRWAGLAAAVVGFLMLSWSGLIPRGGKQPKSRSVARTGKSQEIEPKRTAEPAIGDEFAEIEEILRKRGIS